MIYAFISLAVVLVSIHYQTIATPAATISCHVNYTIFKQNFCRKINVTYILHGKMNVTLKAGRTRMSNFRNVLSHNDRHRRLFIPALASRKSAVTHWLWEAVIAQTSYLTKIGDEGVWSYQQNWRVARLDLKMVELHYAAQRVSLQLGICLTFINPSCCHLNS